MSKPVVLHIRGSDLYGSPERLIIGQMQNMPAIRSIAASFVKPGRPNPFLEQLAGLGLEHIGIDDRLKFDWRIPGHLRAICMTEKVDLIVTHEYKSAVYGYLARRKLPIPQVCYFHGWTRENYRVRLYNALDRMVLRRCDRVVTVSQASARRLIDRGVSPDKISVVYNAISLEPDAIPPERRPNQIPVIGVAGRLSSEKGIHDFLLALAQVRTRSATRFVARVFGSGPEEGRLKRMTTDLKLSDCVSFEGFRSDLDQIYPQLDFLVMPSLSEGHPVVILEGWKHGLGIIATRAGGIPEVVEHTKTGLLTDVGRPDQLAQAIEQALQDIPYMNRLGRAGFERVQTTYSYRRQATQLEEIYREVLQRKHETAD
jgi:glycosyltransferase involved in cell wall biosynthesis